MNFFAAIFKKKRAEEAQTYPDNHVGEDISLGTKRMKEEDDNSLKLFTQTGIGF